MLRKWPSGECCMSSCCTHTRVSSLETAQHERLCVGVLFNNVLSQGGSFGNCCFQTMQLSAETAPNLHSNHQRTEDSANDVLQDRHQKHFSVNFWSGNVGEYLVGQQVLPRRLTVHHYWDLLPDGLPDLLEDYHPRSENAFSSCLMVLQHISAVLCGMSSTVALPSPDWNLLDFHVCRNVKDFVYSTPGQNVE
jgi:hypothetical protein